MHSIPQLCFLEHFLDSLEYIEGNSGLGVNSIEEIDDSFYLCFSDASWGLDWLSQNPQWPWLDQILW